MKTQIFAKVVLISALTASSMFASGIPVVDAAQNAQTLQHNIQEIAEWAKEASRWVETANHYKSQIEAYANQLAAETGIRDAIKFYKEMDKLYKEAKKFKATIEDLPANLKSMSALDLQAQDIINKYLIKDPCPDIKDEVEKEICALQRRGIAKDIGFLNNSINQIQLYSQQLNDLSLDMQKNKGKQEDIKQSLDYANAINMIVAKLQAEKMQMDMSYQSLDRQKELVNQIQKAEGYKHISGQKTDPNLFNFK